MSEAITILLPVYNDNESLQMALRDIGKISADISVDISVVVVNDGSADFKIQKQNPGNNICVIHLNRNLGHQKAIAIGLSYIKENYKDSTVVVMDSDGEDRIQDIPLLLEANKKNNSSIFFAKRKKRTNGITFKLFYYLYKLSFFLTTGKKISFGNFSIIPYPLLCRAVFYTEIWYNYPGGIMKSGLPYQVIPTNRGARYAGRSKMNFSSLLLHGFGAIAVFLEKIIIRVAIISFLLMLISLVAIITIFIIRISTTMAIPGWASTLGTSMFIILLISFIISLISIFTYLTTQSKREFIPALHYKDYILQTETI